MAGNNVKTFNCPSCGSPVEIRAQGQSLSVVCSSCRAVIDSSNENYQVIQKAQSVVAKKLLIPLGKRGKLFGTLWEVIGYMERTDGTGQYEWSEYLLFNPIKGFSWLMLANGHWTHLHRTKNIPKKDLNPFLNKKGKNNADVVYLGRKYQLFHTGVAIVKFVLGEFYWRVSVGDKSSVADYVSPPEILSQEESINESSWSIGQYIDAQQIKESFMITEPMPLPVGVAPNQIASSNSYFKDIYNYTAYFVSFVILLQFGVILISNSKPAYEESFSFRPGQLNDFVGRSFELTANNTNLEVELYSDVNNNWIDVGFDLINEATGEVREFEVGTEYYSGRDYDGNWTEGSRKNSYLLSAVNKGTYHFNVQANGNASLNVPVYFSVKATQNVLTWKNFFLSIIMLMLIPIILFWRRRSFEMKRWSESDYSPYHGENL